MHIVIIGGGFAGIYTAKHLVKKVCKVTLISRTNYFLFTPLLHEVAVGTVNRHNICTPIRDMFSEKNFRLIRSEVSKIDQKKKTVYFDDSSLNYDKLIIATGCQINYFGIEGAEEFSSGLKTVRDAIKIRDRTIELLEDCAIHPKPLSFAVVGAGPTGVELCGDLCDLIEENFKKRYPELKGLKHEFHLIQASEDILPVLGDKARKAASNILEKSGIVIHRNSKVTKVGKDFVQVGEKKIKADLIVWSGGIKPAKLNIIPDIQSESGYIETNEDMSVKDHKDIYALGDIAGKPWLAQSAVQQSRTAADNILGKKESFKFKNKGIIVSLGHRKAVGELYFFGKTFVIKGKLAWYMKRTIYLMNIIGIRNKMHVGFEWILNLIFGRDISEI